MCVVFDFFGIEFISKCERYWCGPSSFIKNVNLLIPIFGN